MLKPQKTNQIGDTIVEVLLAVIVVGLAIGLGYGVASRSLKANQQAQERSEALKQVESQVERLKKAATTDSGAPGGVFNFAGRAFCLVDGANGPEPREVNKPPALVDDPLNDSAYAGGQCVNGLYHLSITPSDSVPNQFDVRARWFGIGQTQKEETVITYRVYPAGT
jgi:type II secretory pathway pseudopilin PulG